MGIPGRVGGVDTGVSDLGDLLKGGEDDPADAIPPKDDGVGMPKETQPMLLLNLVQVRLVPSFPYPLDPFPLFLWIRIELMFADHFLDLVRRDARSVHAPVFPPKLLLAPLQVLLSEEDEVGFFLLGDCPGPPPLGSSRAIHQGSEVSRLESCLPLHERLSGDPEVTGSGNPILLPGAVVEDHPLQPESCRTGEMQEISPMTPVGCLAGKMLPPTFDDLIRPRVVLG